MVQLEWWSVHTELSRVVPSSSSADWGGHKHPCTHCYTPQTPFLAGLPPLFSHLWKGHGKFAISSPFCCLQGAPKCCFAALVMSEYPQLATASLGSWEGLLGAAEGKYSSAGDSRLSSRTKRLHCPSDVGKESLTEPWCISAEPGSCCSQRDLTPLWHCRAQGKFF